MVESEVEGAGEARRMEGPGAELQGGREQAEWSDQELGEIQERRPRGANWGSNQSCRNRKAGVKRKRSRARSRATERDGGRPEGLKSELDQAGTGSDLGGAGVKLDRAGGGRSCKASWIKRELGLAELREKNEPKKTSSLSKLPLTSTLQRKRKREGKRT